MEWYVVLAVLVGVLLALMLMGLPIAVSIGLVGFTSLLLRLGPASAISALGDKLFSYWTGYTLLAVPLYVFLAESLTHADVVADLFDVVSKWFTRIPGGLALATILTGALFATLSGVSVASVAALGIITLPEMLKKGIQPSAGCWCCSCRRWLGASHST